MYNYFFGFLYKYYDNDPNGNKSKVPFLSSILVLSVLVGLNFISLRDIYLFQIKGVKASLLSYNSTIILSLLILFNYLYFKGRYRRVLKEYDAGNRAKRLMSLLYILVTLALAIITAYSIRNNLHWWE